MEVCRLARIAMSGLNGPFSGGIAPRVAGRVRDLGGGLCSQDWENYISISFQLELDMIVVTVFLSILNQMELHLVQNRKENYHHDHIPFNVKGNGSVVFSVRAACSQR